MAEQLLQTVLREALAPPVVETIELTEVEVVQQGQQAKKAARSGEQMAFGELFYSTKE